MVRQGDSIEVLLNRIDDTFQSKARLGIVAALAASCSLDFKALKAALGLSDGNLSSHLSYLERRGFVRSEKSFVRKRSHTELFLTEDGRIALGQYVDVLEAIVDRGKRGNEGE
jgi:DNA-binding MarR family transcriptional regulator